MLKQLTNPINTLLRNPHLLRNRSRTHTTFFQFPHLLNINRWFSTEINPQKDPVEGNYRVLSGVMSEGYPSVTSDEHVS